MKKAILFLFFVCCGYLPAAISCSGTFYTCGDDDQLAEDAARNCPSGSVITFVDVCSEEEILEGEIHVL